MEKRIFKRSKDFLTRKSSVVVLLIFILLAILAVVSIRHTWNRVVKQNSEEAIKTAKIAANSLSGEMLKKLIGVQEDAGTIAYVSIKKRLINIKSILSDARFVYLFTKREGKIFFIADSEPENSKDYSPPGQEYTEADTNYIKLFDIGEELITPPITDRWGTWVSIHVPIKDETTGRTIAVFGMDYDADRWKSSIVFDVLRGSVVIVIAFLLFLILSIKLVLQNKVLKNEAIERKQAEAELKESEEKFKGLSEESPNMIFINKAGRVVYINKKCEEILGYTRDEFLDSRFNFLDLIAPEHVEMVKDNFANRYKGKAKDSYEYTLVTKDKRRIETSISAKIITYEGENAILWIVTDITEHKRSELERLVLYEIIHGITTTANLNELLKLIHQSLGKVVYAENCFVALYDQKTKLFGFPYFVDKFDPTPEPFAMHKSYTAYIFRTGKPLLLTQELFDNLVEQNEVELVGTNAPSWVGVPLKTHERTIGVLVIQHYEEENVYSERDVQFLDSVGSQIAFAIEQKRAEEALLKSATRFREMFDDAPIGYHELDADGRITRVNSTELKLLGYTEEEMIGQFVWKFVEDEGKSQQRVLEKLKGTLLPAINAEHVYCCKDLTKFPVLCEEIILRDAKDNIIGIRTTIQDITERNKAELIIKQQNNELQELNATKDKFFSIIAHDLRSPFQGFLGMTEMMTENIDEFSTEELVTFITEMNQSAQNLYKLLQNLLDWAQLKKGSFSFTPEEFSLSTTVSASIEQINKRAIQKGITIINEVPEEQKVFVDERMINSILGNLLSNAIKFTRKDGKVTVKAKMISNGMVEIAVEDTGVGISERVVNKLFKIDEKVGSKGTDGEKSTGLGLLLCKEFVEKHGGRIWVESEEGKGSSFYFTLPKREGSNL